MSPTVAIAAGGTGGHVLPGLAIADALASIDDDVGAVFVGVDGGIEHDLVPAAGYAVRSTPVRPFGSGLRAVTGPASLVRAVPAARAILRSEGVDVVVGMGGYPSLPVVLAARWLGLPAIIHEANSVAGIANVVAARVTPHVAVTYEATAGSFGRRTPRVTGMPLRPAIAGLDRVSTREEARAAFELPPGVVAVFAFGGSLGAHSIGSAMVDLAQAWSARDDVRIVLAAGGDKYAALAARAGQDAPIRIEPYIDRMDLAYAAADVVVARAGSSTVAEIAAVGLPSVLVPYPHARRREQHGNAALLGEAGAAIVIEDADIGVHLEGALSRWVGDPEERARAGVAARSVARTDAGPQIARWALGLVAS